MPRTVMPTRARVRPIMITTVAQETRLKLRELVHSPMMSTLLINSTMKMRTKGQQHAVEHLGEQNHPDERKPGPEHDAGADDDQQRVEPVKDRRVCNRR